MLRLTDLIQPKYQEAVQVVFRRQRGQLVLPLGMATVFIVVPFFFIFSLWQWRTWGIILFAGLLSIGLAIGLRALLLWDANATILTNERLIQVTQLGVLHRKVQEVGLSSVTEISYESKGLLQSLFRVGTLRIRASGATSELILEKIAAPQRAQSAIQSARAAISTKTDGNKIENVESAEPDTRQQVHALVDTATSTTLETVKALLEKRA